MTAQAKRLKTALGDIGVTDCRVHTAFRWAVNDGGRPYREYRYAFAVVAASTAQIAAAEAHEDIAYVKRYPGHDRNGLHTCLVRSGGM